MSMKDLEHFEQVKLLIWFENSYPDVFIYHTPNGGHRHPAVAKKLKQAGVKKGVPDLHIPAWNLWVEMKADKKGKLTPEQKYRKEYLESIGHKVIVGLGFLDAKEKIENFKKSH